jgi:hypothetical protein
VESYIIVIDLDYVRFMSAGHVRGFMEMMAGNLAGYDKWKKTTRQIDSAMSDALWDLSRVSQLSYSYDDAQEYGEVSIRFQGNGWAEVLKRWETRGKEHLHHEQSCAMATASAPNSSMNLATRSLAVAGLALAAIAFVVSGIAKNSGPFLKGLVRLGELHHLGRKLHLRNLAERCQRKVSAGASGPEMTKGQHEKNKADPYHEESEQGCQSCDTDRWQVSPSQ